jgi:hypothetical protein
MKRLHVVMIVASLGAAATVPARAATINAAM